MIKKYNLLFKRNDILEIFILILLAFVIETRAPQIVATLFYIFTLFRFFTSKKNYIWIAFTLIIYNYTGGFFGSHHEIISSGLFSFSYIEGFSFVALLKTLSLKKISIFYKKPFIIYFIYFGFLIGLGAMHGMLYGKTGFGLLYMLIKNIILLPMFFSIPNLIDREKGLQAFANILFAVIYLNLLGQFFTVFARTSFFSIASSKIEVSNDSFVRPIYGYYNVFLTLFLAIYFISFEKAVFKKKYLGIVIFLCGLSIFLTATRGWIIAISLILVSWIIFNFRSMKMLPILLPLFLVLFSLILKLSPTIENQLAFSMDRMSTLESLSQGDLTAGNTLLRLTTRHDLVMKKFYEKPIFGWGFSSEGFEANDYHVGNQSILMSGGIVGMLVILYMLLFIIKKTANLYGFIKKRGMSARSLMLIVIFLIGLFVIHSTSTQLFGFLPYLYPLHFNKLVFLSIMFAFFNILFIGQYNKCISFMKNKNA